jgi:long-chain fatty acid transport protein
MKSRLLNLLAGIGSMIALCLHSSPAEAIFASVKSTGMAATAISYPLDSLALAYNPAGLTDVGDRFDLEAAWVQNWASANVSGNRLPSGALNPLVNGHFDGMRTKYIFPVGFGLNKLWCFCDDWTIATGLGVYNRNYQKTTFKKVLVLLGTSKPGLEYLHETVAPTIAVQWCNKHALGVSVNYQVERIKVNGLQNFDRPVIPGIPGGSIDPGHVTNRGYDYATGWGVTVGYLGHITDCLSIGATYQPKTSMSRMSKYKGFLAHRGRLNIPQKIGAGISYRILPCLVAAFDVEHIQWSKIKSLHNNLLYLGTLQPLGSQNGPGFGFRDQWYYRVGAEWQYSDCLAFRAGYRFANTPIKRSQTAVNLLTLDCVQSFATIGGTWCINPCNEVSFAFAYGFQHKVKGKNSIPIFLGGGEVDLKEEKFALAIAWGYQF